MSRNVRIVFGVGSALLLVCVCGAIAMFSVLGVTIGRAVESDPAHIAAAASRIADFQPPSGYKPEVTIDLGGYLFVSYAPGDGHSHIMFVQAPASANVEQATLEQYAQQATQNRDYDSHTHLQVVGQQQATVRGQTVTLVVSEGTNSDGAAYRTLTGVFQGKGGLALLSVEAPLSHWNQTEVEAFLASTR